MKKYLLLFGLATLALFTGAQAQEDPKYKVIIGQIPGMVETQFNGVHHGYEIDLWREISRRLGLEYEFIKAENFEEVLEEIADKQADFALAGISVKKDRLEDMSFSHPYYATNARAIVFQQPISMWDSVATLLSPLVLQTVFMYLFFCGIFGILFWWLERKHENDIRSTWYPGIFDGVWYAFKKSWGVQSHASRALVLPLWIVTLLFSSLITAQVISNFEVQKAKSLVSLNQNDLSKVSLGVRSGTTTADGALQNVKNFERVVQADTIGQLYQLLLNKEVNSVAADSLIINQIYGQAKKDGLPVVIHPKNFSQEYYAIAMSKEVPEELKKAIDEIIMELRDEHFLLALEEQWLSVDALTKNIKVKLEK